MSLFTVIPQGPFESNGRKQLSLSSCGWVLIRSGQFIITWFLLSRCNDLDDDHSSTQFFAHRSLSRPEEGAWALVSVLVWRTARSMQQVALRAIWSGPAAVWHLHTQYLASSRGENGGLCVNGYHTNLSTCVTVCVGELRHHADRTSGYPRRSSCHLTGALFVLVFLGTP